MFQNIVQSQEKLYIYSSFFIFFFHFHKILLHAHLKKEFYLLNVKFRYVLHHSTFLFILFIILEKKKKKSQIMSCYSLRNVVWIYTFAVLNVHIFKILYWHLVFVHLYGHTYLSTNLQCNKI